MRILATLLSTGVLFVFANAQNISSTAVTSAEVLSVTTTSEVVSGTASLSPAQSSQAVCLESCPATDPNCRAKCVSAGVPTGDYGQQNATIECVSSCDHGNGTAAENLDYENCLKACVASATITPESTAAPTSGAGSAATGSSGSGGTDSVNAKTTQATGTDSGAIVTATSSASPSTSSKGAAENIRARVSLAGVMGIFAAAMWAL